MSFQPTAPAPLRPPLGVIDGRVNGNTGYVPRHPMPIPNGPMTDVPVYSRPGELPVPYHGHAQYSHQLHAPHTSDSPVTPSTSGPPSQKSSRAPSPIPGQKYDALEGQFSGNLHAGTPQSPSLDTNTPPPMTQKSVGLTQPFKPPMSHGTPIATNGNTSTSAQFNQQSSFNQMPPATQGYNSTHLVNQMGYSGGHNSVPPQMSVSGGPPAMNQRGIPSINLGPPQGSLNQTEPLPTNQRVSLPVNRSGPPTSMGQVGPLPAAGSPQGISQSVLPPAMGQQRDLPASIGQTGLPPAMSQPGPPPSMNQPGTLPSLNQSGLPPSMGSPPTMGQTGPPPAMSQTGPPPAMGQPGPLHAMGQTGPPPAMSQSRPPLSMGQHGPPPSMGQHGPTPAIGQPGLPPPLASQNGPQPAMSHSGPPSVNPSGPQQSVNQSIPQPVLNQTIPPPTTSNQIGSIPQQTNAQSTVNHLPPSAPYYQSNQSQPPPPTTSSTMSNMQQPQFPSSAVRGIGSSPLNSMQQLNTIADSTTLNLLQDLRLIPGTGLDDIKPNLPNDYKKAMCSSDVFRCTLSSLPDTQSLLNKSRLPLGILIHPFRDLSQLPVIQSNVIVRCRSCRTYINPYVTFVDMRRWKCNLCFRINELPEEFNYDPLSRTYGEPQRRPEIRSSTMEFIAPSEYMLRPPQPAVYMFVIDVSFNAISTGYLPMFCETLLAELDNLPGDARTHIGFLTFDRSLHFYNLAEGLSQPQMLVVSDIEDIFLPSPDSLLVNLQQSKDLVIDLLQQLPTMFENNMESGSALGAALQASYKLMSSTGGRVTVMQTQLPTIGPGALKSREDPNQRAGTGKINNLGPATDFYKKLSLECSAQQIAVDIFMLNTQYADISSIACISKYSGGSVYHFNGLNSTTCPGEAKRYQGTLKRYFTRKIGFEAVMRIRCTRGLSIHTFHGNFFVRSTDLLSLPNVNPDAGFGMQMSIDDKLDGQVACFQAALLYTSSKGERRIRVHTMCLPVTNQLSEVYAGADQKAIIGLLAKMAADKSMTQSVGDARDAIMYSAVDMLTAYGSTQIPASGRVGQLPLSFSLRCVPLFIMALLKYKSFRTGVSTRLDERVYALENCKTMPLQYLLMEIYPHLYPVHALDDQNAISEGDSIISQPPLLQLSSANMDRHGAYLMDTGTHMYLWIGAAISDQFVSEVLGVSTFAEVEDCATQLPELNTESSERLLGFIQNLNSKRPYPASLLILREDSRSRHLYTQYLVEDRTESTMSYYEFLKYLQQQIKA